MRARRDAVGRENRAAAANTKLSPTDPRWVLAVRAYSQLQGSALTPERRERVLETARLLGVRPFDANVIIAIAQDHARRGEPLAGAAPTLSIVARPPEDSPRARRTRRAWTALRWIAALAAAITATTLLIRWLNVA